MVPKVSVIVPVYNIEKYLMECLESIAAQTLKEIQVLLIDDGSKDTSAQICKDFIRSHPNFEYYYKENGGTASARNVGLQHAAGEYIGFVDSDDWIEPDMFATIYQAAKEADADIVYCKMAGLMDYVDLPEGIYGEKEIREVIYPAILPHVVPSGTFRTMDWGNWSRLFKRSLIQSHQIRMHEKSRRCEDFAFSVECAMYAKTYVILNAGELYHYRPNENSKSRAYTKNMWRSIRSLMTYMIEITNRYAEYDFTQAMQTCVFYFCTSVIRNEMRLSDKSQRIENIRQIVTDPLCVGAVNAVSCRDMNPEYTAMHSYMKQQDAVGLTRYLKQLAWKKKYVTPVLDKLFKNAAVRNLYRKIRGR